MALDLMEDETVIREGHPSWRATISQVRESVARAQREGVPERTQTGL